MLKLNKAQKLVTKQTSHKFQPQKIASEENSRNSKMQTKNPQVIFENL
jgi:hypothetical protein